MRRRKLLVALAVLAVAIAVAVLWLLGDRPSIFLRNYHPITQRMPLAVVQSIK